MPQQPTVDRLAYRPAEAARMLGISRAKLYQFLADGTLPSVKLDGSRLITRQALEGLIAPDAA